MNDDIAIKVEHVSKKFCKSLKRSMLYGIKDIGRNMIGLGSNSDKLRKDEFWAVDEISFDLKKGETLGIIGPNGSGKTTLLKMLNGIFWPDKGKISIRGKTGALIAVGAGFHQMLTGRENIYINGAILGLSKKEIDGKLESIIEFANIGEFIDSPVKFYSSGMFVRLGFSVAVTVEPAILLIDEVLSVGDMDFQNKSLQKLAKLREKSNAVIFVSHNLLHVRNLCDKVLILNKGKQVFYGDTQEAIIRYHEIVRENKLQKFQEQKVPFFQHFSSGVVTFLDAGIIDIHGVRTNAIRKDDDINCFFEFELKEFKNELICGVSITDKNRTDVILQYSHDNEVNFCNISKGKYRLIVNFTKPNLNPGIYMTSIVIRDRITGETYEKIIGLSPFSIVGKTIPLGRAAIKSNWEMINIDKNIQN